MTPAEFEWADEQIERRYRNGEIGRIEFLKQMSNLGFGPKYLNFLVDEIDKEKAALTAGEHHD